MVALTAKGRRAKASSGYPMPDKKHARLAKSGASHAYHVGNISKATERRIDAKADRILGKKGK
ncbi:MAG TPA: hypothetical protein VMU08_08215 [Rhizomicrobium sp.]|nr:hypothetical protein [Rhizomicrobium sp.]